MNLMPSNKDLNLIYNCPHCGYEHWKRSEEVQYPNQKIHCICKNILHLQQLTNIRVVVDKTKPLESKVQPPPIVDSMLKTSALPLIKTQGFSAKEAKRLIGQVYQHSTPTTVLELVRLAISESNHESATTTT